MMTLDVRSFAYDDDGAALADLNLTLSAGERVLVAGASGSGKSTLARLLAGQYDPGQGQRFVGSVSIAGERLVFEGSPDDPRINAAAWAAQVGYVGQRAQAQLSLICSTVGEEIAFGPSNWGVPVPQLQSLVSAVADRVGLSGLLDRDPRHLSGGELQRVCIAAAVVSNPALLVLDEPFKGLDAAGRRDIEELIGRITGEGTAVVQFEPMLPADLASVDRVLILAGGTVADEHPVPQEISLAEAARHGVGRESAQTAVVLAVGPAGQGTEAQGRPVLEISGLHFSYDSVPALAVRDLRVYPGEAVAVLGPNGSGKSTLLQHVNGLLRPGSGSIRLIGREISGIPTGRLASTVGYLFQDTDQQLFERTVLKEVAYGPRAAGLSARKAEQRASTALAAVGLLDRAEVHPHDLGFTQRRLVALASILATGPSLWVLDEPTVGLDLAGREVLARVLRSHLDNGGAVLTATHDSSFAADVCTRGVRLESGVVTEHWTYRHGAARL